ncbi:DUF7033 domain-containing protein [Pedobacter zeae]|uniref:DUF7033 domain-containing protein n=1 Tax=Pedobacter zeae TaxID=1737356 RepID=A0A7W6KFX6_9SPHI|nr:hypothetical protein [Pedobacter zeae]MBB4109802.1 hypothetical protein [Pedobacter zeae]GGH14320.1 hypothetical protein GCM10007422_35560 [Pedobacter zeae]
MHLIIFSDILTPRIKYTFNFIFKDILKAEIEFTGNSQYFLQSEQVKISYGNKQLGDEIFFKSTALLFSNKLEELKPKTIAFGEYLVPFPVEQSALPFDVFAASFFMLSRYEEYLHQKNTEEEFRPLKSLQHKWKVLNKPVIDEWALMIKSIIKKKYPSFKFHEKKFHHQPTIHFNILPGIPKGFLNRTKFVFSALFKKENNYLSSKFDQLTGIGLNNEQVLEEINKIAATKKDKPLYFIDFPNVSIHFTEVNGVSKHFKDQSVGLLRPCVSDKQKMNEIKEGLIKLKKIHPVAIPLTSQQLETLKFPICYLNILNSGITADYSMGYSNVPGFRAGTCTPFNWYDLQLEKVTPLVVNSYCLTDDTLQYLTRDSAVKILHQYIDAVKVVNGTFYSCWNLKNLSNLPKYKKLRLLFIEMLSYSGN